MSDRTAEVRKLIENVIQQCEENTGAEAIRLDFNGQVLVDLDTGNRWTLNFLGELNSNITDFSIIELVSNMETSRLCTDSVDCTFCLKCDNCNSCAFCVDCTYLINERHCELLCGEEEEDC